MNQGDGMSEHDDLEELERELGAIFDATAFQPELGQVNDAARLAAQVPSVAREGWWYWKHWAHNEPFKCS